MGTLVWKPAADTYAESQNLIVAKSRTYTFLPGIPEFVIPEDVAQVTTALKAIQGTMTSAGQPTTVTAGTPGTTTVGYKVVATSQSGDTIPSTERTIATAAATLTGVNFVTITKGTLPAHATGWKVIRTTAGGTPSTTGLISTTTPLATTVSTFNDTGIAALAYTAAVAQPSIGLVAAGPTDA